MTVLGETAHQAIDENREMLIRLARDIWEQPEGPYKEYISSERSAEILRNAGFRVETGVGGVPTAIRAEFGTGHPVIALLGEYDALPGLSQKLVAERCPVVAGGWGHGCGHNLMAAGPIGAVLGLQKEMTEGKLPGTVVFFGCPAEEVLTGKAFMARGGAFEGIDVAVSWHPGRKNEVSIGENVGLNSFKLRFKGRTAHAGGDPQNGRSALDAVELTNVGAQYLREHVTDDVRIHYVITEGGTAPNIVPDDACVWYYVRAKTREGVEDTYERLLKVARGAAMMTETELTVEFLGGCHPTLTNQVIAKVIHECLLETPQEPWSEEEIAFARALNMTAEREWERAREKIGASADTQLHAGVSPIRTEGSGGSTDVGDVCHIVPTATFSTASFNLGAPGHSWQITASAGSSIGEKGMILAAKVLALFGMKVLTDPAILEEAQAEFVKTTGGKPYACPIPDEIPVPR